MDEESQMQTTALRSQESEHTEVLLKKKKNPESYLLHIEGEKRDGRSKFWNTFSNYIASSLVSSWITWKYLYQQTCLIVKINWAIVFFRFSARVPWAKFQQPSSWVCLNAVELLWCKFKACNKQWQGRTTRNIHLIFMPNTVILY